MSPFGTEAADVSQNTGFHCRCGSRLRGVKVLKLLQNSFNCFESPTGSLRIFEEVLLVEALHVKALHVEALHVEALHVEALRTRL